MGDIRDIETPRLLLRPMTPTSLAAIVAGEARPDWAAGYPTDGDVEIASLMVQAEPAYDAAALGFLHRHIVERASGLVIGGIGFHGLPRDGQVEVGYGIAAPRRQHGFATEALRAILGHAWSRPEVRMVVAGTEIGNIASQRVLVGAGFSRLGLDGDQIRFAVRRPAR